jgi:hypothetical protein
MVLNMQCFMPHFSIDNTLPKYSWLMMIMVWIYSITSIHGYTI